MKGKGCVIGLIVFLTCIIFATSVSAQEESKMPYNFSTSTVDVDPHSGSASTSIPITLPQGRGSIQPNISLVYNSSLKNGMLGVGWSLELGSIIRSVKKGVPKYDNSDEFLLLQNGSTQELVLDNSAGYYRTRIEGAFMRTEFIGDHWVVTDRNNVKYYFGKTSASRQYDPNDSSRIFKWCLDKVEDRFGNYMEINYLKDEGNALYPEEILYAGNSSRSLSPYARIKIGLESRSDKTSSYLSGFKVSFDKRINKIKVFAEGQVQRKYIINYSYSELSKRSLLASVTQYSSDLQEYLPAMTFTYKDKRSAIGSFHLESYSEMPPESKFSTRKNGRDADLAVRIVDVNSDGYPDMIKNYRKDRQNDIRIQKIFINKGYSVEGVENSWGYLQYPFLGWESTDDWQLPSDIMPFLDSWPEIDREWGLRFADVNGDNYVDILYYYKEDNWEGGRLHNEVYINNKTSGWEKNVDWAMPVSPESPFVQRRGQPEYCYHDFLGTVMADVNADGYVDLIKSKEGYAQGHLSFMNNVPAGGKGWSRDPSWDTPDSPYTDFAKGAALIDINGDSLPDIFYSKNGVVKVFMNIGHGWEEDTSSPWISSNAGAGDLTKGDTQFGDINGDGMIDMIIAKENFDDGSTVLVNTSNGWEQENDWLLNKFNFENMGTRIVDSDGDGLLEFIINDDEEANVYTNYLKNADLLISVKNGYGGNTEIDYIASTRLDNIFLPFPLKVVKSVTVSNGGFLEVAKRYEYSNGLWVPDKKEFRGFGTLKVFDAEGNYSLTNYLQDDMFKGRMASSETRDAEGNVFSKSENTWDSVNISDGVDFVFLKRSDNYVYDGNDTGRRTASEYFYEEPEQYGNLTKKIDYGEVDLQTGEDKGSDRLIEEVSYYNVEGENRLLGIVKERVLKDGEGNKISGTRFYYDGSGSFNIMPDKGLLTKKEQWAGDGTGDVYPVVEYTYDEFGNVITTKDPMGNVSSIIYDPQYHMFPVSAKNAVGQSSSSEFYGVNGVPLDDGSGLNGLWGQLKSTTDVNSKTSFKAYDTFGRNIKVIGPLDSVQYPSLQISYDYGPDMRRVITKKRVEHGQEKTIDEAKFYDGLGELIRAERLSAEGEVIISGVSSHNSRGLTKYRYLPYVKESVSPLLIFFDLGAWFSSMTNENVPRSETAYDAIGRPIKTINPDGTFSTVEYDDWTTTGIDENGHMQKSYFDAYGHLIKKEEYVGADGRSQHYPIKPYSLYSQTTYKYDALGNLIETKDAHGNITSINYDKLGRKISMRDPDMGSWSYEYDLNGNLISQLDAKGQEITFMYDPLNRLINKSGGGALNVDYVYDDDSLENSKGKLTSVYYPGGEACFYYDETGREAGSAKKIDDIEYHIQRNYDAMDRLIDIQYPDERKLYYKYNDAGQVDSVSEDGALIGPQSKLNMDNMRFASRKKDSLFSKAARFASDFYTKIFEPYVLGIKEAEAMSMLIKTPSKPELSVVQTGSTWVELQWDIPSKADGIYLKYGEQRGSYANILDLGYADGTTVQGLTPGTKYYFAASAYNSYGESGDSDEVEVITLVPVTIPAAGPTSYIRNVDYNINGQVTKIEYDNATMKSYEYDELTLRLMRIYTINVTGDILQDLNYAYDSAGNILSIADNVSGSIQSFEYDELNRLVRAEGDYGAKTYVYDEIGNIVEKDGKTYYYGEGGAGPHAVTTTDDGVIRTTYTYDENGSMATKQVNSSELTQYEYNVENRLVEVVKDGLIIAEYNYDGDGGRTKETKYDGYTSQTSYFVGSLFEKNNKGDTDNIYLGSTRIASVNNDNVLYYHADHLGGTNVVADSVGMKKEVLEYEPFGKITKDERFGTDEEASMFQFTGKRFNEDTGLYFFESRYYDPELGRFITADNISPNPFDLQGFNRYSYVRNNPVNFIDPTGHFFWAAIAAVVKTMSAAATAVASYVTANAAVIATGAIVGGSVGGISAVSMGGNFGKGFGIGAIGGGVFAGLTPGLSILGDNIARGVTLGGAAGPLTQGTVMWSNFGSAFLSGAGAGAVVAGYTGTDVSNTALFGGAISGGFSLISDAAFWMRQKMVEQSKLDPRNSSGISVGFKGDGFKLGGGRYNPVYPKGNPSLLGGEQGGVGQLFGMSYTPGSIWDRIVEAYAGPHDFLNSWGYDMFGNLKNQSTFESILGVTLNPLNVVVATPIVIPSVFPRSWVPPPVVIYGQSHGNIGQQLKSEESL